MGAVSQGPHPGGGKRSECISTRKGADWFHRNPTHSRRSGARRPDRGRFSSHWRLWRYEVNATTATTATTAAPSPSEQAITASQWPVTASTYITEAQGIDEVRAGSTATGHALRTTYARASAMLGDSGAQPNVNPNTVVWIVTVDGPTPYVSSPPPGSGAGAPTTMAPKYQSVVMDAANGGEIDSCLGCDSVTSG